jgi:hypothetical protein
MLDIAAFILLISTAIFIPMFLMMYVRTCVTGKLVSKPSEFIIQHGLTLLELFLSVFLAARYVPKPELSPNTSFWDSTKYCAEFCILSIVICSLLFYCELLSRKCIAKYSFSAVNDRFLSLIKNVSARIHTADETVYKKTRFHIDELLAIALIITAACFTFNRVFYGTEKTDEAYYYAEALSVLQGNLPYAYNNSSSVGMSFLMIIPMAIYRIIRPDMAGIFLYMRICYILFQFVVTAAIYSLLRKQISRRKRLWLILMLIPYLDLVNPAFSYNSVGKYMILLSGIVLFFAVSNSEKGSRKTGLTIFSAGFIAAIGVLAHPLQLFGAIVLTLLLLLYGRGGLAEKAKGALLYISGGIAEALVVFIPICAEAGTAMTFSGVSDLLFQKNAIQGGVPLSVRWAEMIRDFGHSWKAMTITFIAVLSLLSIYQLVRKREWSLRDRVLFAGGISVLLSGQMFIDILWRIGGPMIWLGIMFMLFIRGKFFAFAALPCIIFFIAELLLVKNGSVMMRGLYLYPILFCWLFAAFQSSRRSVIALSAAVSVIAAVSLIKQDYNYVYRDSPISRLTYKVPAGIYKGMYTTEKNAHDLMELENYLKSNIGADEKVQFRDNTPMAYLMHTEGTISDIRTWDCMQYTYRGMGTNNPQNMYRYYKRTGSIPDKIIYIDFGRDRQLSIEDPSWKYNKFVNSYYDRQSAVRLNPTFRVVIYKYNGKFDGNYDRWIQSVK